MLSVRKLSFHYRGGDPILRDVSFDAEPGRCVALLGNNGAGKSTLLKCVNRILQADAGSVRLNDTELLSLPQREIARRIAFVAQTLPQTQLTVYDTVLLGRRPYMKWGFTAEDRQIVENVLAQMELTGMRSRYVDQLSGGEQQKVLLLDEPTSNLDLQNQHQVLGIVRRICEETGITALVIIHDLNLALRYCDRFLMMRDGEICFYGGPEIVSRQSIDKVYRIQADVVNVNGKRVVLAG